MKGIYILSLCYFILLPNCFCMELCTKKEPIKMGEQKFFETLTEQVKKNNITNVRKLFNINQELIPTKSSNTSSHLLKEASEAANKNLERAKKQLGWWGNTSRISKATSGIAAILGGVVKCGYDISSFGAESTDTTKNSFDTIENFLVVFGGCLVLKEVIENSSGKYEYFKAVEIYDVMELMKDSYKNTNQNLLEQLEQ